MKKKAHRKGSRSDSRRAKLPADPWKQAHRDLHGLQKLNELQLDLIRNIEKTLTDLHGTHAGALSEG